MKNAIVLALLVMRMVAEEIVKDVAGNQPRIWKDVPVFNVPWDIAAFRQD
jgi:hypothetical protein